MTKLRKRIIVISAIVALSVPASWIGVQYSDAYDAAVSHTRQNTQIRTHLGEIQDVYLSVFGYKVAVSGARGDASFTLKLKGLHANATVYIELAKFGTWRPTASRLVLQSGTAIDLIP